MQSWSQSQAPFTTPCDACGRRVAGEQAERARRAHRPLVICDRCVTEAPEANSPSFSTRAA